MILGITTAPRKIPTLAKSIHSLIQAGWKPEEIHIFAEPGVAQIQDVHWHQNPEQLGCFHNFVHMSRFLVEHDDTILTVQDDIDVHPDSKDFLESILWPAKDCGFVSLYSAKHYQEGFPFGLNRIKTGSLWGTLFLAWQPSVLQSVIDTKIFREWKGATGKTTDPKKLKNVDTAIGKALNFMNKGMYFLNPSPVSHIAATSAVGHGGNRGRRNCLIPADKNRPLRDQIFPPPVKPNTNGDPIPGTNACYYLGEVKRFEKDIYKNAPAPVFECQKYGECVLKRIDRSGIRRCIACKDNRPTGNLVKIQ